MSDTFSLCTDPRCEYYGVRHICITSRLELDFVFLDKATAPVSPQLDLF